MVDIMYNLIREPEMKEFDLSSVVPQGAWHFNKKKELLCGLVQIISMIFVTGLAATLLIAPISALEKCGHWSWKYPNLNFLTKSNC